MRPYASVKADVPASASLTSMIPRRYRQVAQPDQDSERQRAGDQSDGRKCRRVEAAGAKRARVRSEFAANPTSAALVSANVRTGAHHSGSDHNPQFRCLRLLPGRRWCSSPTNWTAPRSTTRWRRANATRGWPRSIGVSRRPSGDTPIIGSPSSKRGASPCLCIGSAGVARVLQWMARRFGAAAVVSIIANQEIADAQRYAVTPDRAPGMDADERGHARALPTIVGDQGAEGPFIARLEGRHRTTAGNALRAAVLGANDGLVSNLSLVMGVAGASLGGREIVITGLAGLLAGAGSMALGEWLSVQSSRELYEKQIAIEERGDPGESRRRGRRAGADLPGEGTAGRAGEGGGGALDAERGVRARHPRARGAGHRPERARRIGAAGGDDVVHAVRGRRDCAGLAVFLPDGERAIAASLVASAIGLFAIGAAITVLTGRSVWFSGTRQVLVGLGAAALTFAIGRLIGVSLQLSNWAWVRARSSARASVPDVAWSGGRGANRPGPASPARARRPTPGDASPRAAPLAYV